MNALVVLLIALPLAGCLAVLAMPERYAAGFGILAAGATLADATAMAASFGYQMAGRMQFQVSWVWAAAIGLRFHLGADGVSLPLIVLTALLTLLCMIYTAGHSLGRTRLLVSLLLLLEAGLLGTFTALDLVLFFLFFETVLIPMYAVIAIWGGPGRRPAAVKFLLYTVGGSGVMLAGLMLIYARAGTLDMVTLAARHGAGLSHGFQILAFVLVAAGLAVKVPMWPLHSWLPDAHSEAPTVGSVLLAGALLKMGTYGLIRIAVPVLPEGARALAPFLGAFGVAGIVYGALACLAQRDLKRLIAFSSIGHMGFVLLGIATLTPVGINAALFGNVAHGLITGLLFFLAGAVKERYGTTDMTRLGGGMLTTVPRLASIITLAAIASLGLPGLAGFWGEMLAMLGAYHPAAGLGRGLFLAFMAVAGVGAVLTAAYFLGMLRRVTQGTVPASWRAVSFRDVTAGEVAVCAPLVLGVVVVGLWPAVLLDVTNAAVHHLLGAP
jgi:NADH-quinone oxidoreductase subunit M